MYPPYQEIAANARPRLRLRSESETFEPPEESPTSSVINLNRAQIDSPRESMISMAYTSNALGVSVVDHPDLITCMARGSVGSTPGIMIGAVALVELTVASLIVIIPLCPLAGEKSGISWAFNKRQ